MASRITIRSVPLAPVKTLVDNLWKRVDDESEGTIGERETRLTDLSEQSHMPFKVSAT